MHRPLFQNISGDSQYGRGWHGISVHLSEPHHQSADPLIYGACPRPRLCSYSLRRAAGGLSGNAWRPTLARRFFECLRGEALLAYDAALAEDQVLANLQRGMGTTLARR